MIDKQERRHLRSNHRRALAVTTAVATGSATACWMRHRASPAVQGWQPSSVPVSSFGPLHARVAGDGDHAPCGAGPIATRRTILITVTNPYGDDVKKERERATLTLGLEGQGAGDVALRVYEATAAGERGEVIDTSDEIASINESLSVTVTTTADEETKYFLVDVFFHAWAGTWGLDASFS